MNIVIDGKVKTTIYTADKAPMSVDKTSLKG